MSMAVRKQQDMAAAAFATIGSPRLKLVLTNRGNASQPAGTLP
jgi:hypothetical protein